MSEARLVRGVVARHQEMREQPRFGVENSLAIAFIVLRRVVDHGKQLGQRHELFLRQQPQVMLDGAADADLGAGGFEGGINLGHSLLEPERPELVVTPEQQMGVLVEDDLHFGESRVGARQGEHNQVFVAAAIEEGRQVCGLAPVKRQEWLQRFLIGKSQHHNRRRRHRLCPGQQGVGLAKLLQPPGKFVNILRRAATVDVEMRGARLQPAPLRERNIVRLAGSGANAQRQEHGKNPKRVANHR